MEADLQAGQQSWDQVMDWAGGLVAKHVAAGDLAKGSAALAEGWLGSALRLEQAEFFLACCWGLPLQGLLSQVLAGTGSQQGFL